MFVEPEVENEVAPELSPGLCPDTDSEEVKPSVPSHEDSIETFHQGDGVNLPVTDVGPHYEVVLVDISQLQCSILASSEHKIAVNDGCCDLN